MESASPAGCGYGVLRTLIIEKEVASCSINGCVTSVAPRVSLWGGAILLLWQGGLMGMGSWSWEGGKACIRLFPILVRISICWNVPGEAGLLFLRYSLRVWAP